MRTRRKSASIIMKHFIYSLGCFLILSFSNVNAQSTSGTRETPGTENTELRQDTDPEIPTDDAVVAHGKELFGQHCAACHQIDQQIIGPALASVHQTRPLPWLIRFIKNSQMMITEEKDEYAQQLFEQYQKIVMPPFEFLSNDDIMAILAYIKSESVSGTEYGGVSGAGSVATPDPYQESDAGEEAYSQKKDSERDAGDVSSGVPGSLAFGVIIGMIILIGIIFIVARRSGKSTKKM